jgi:hypothetical protein
MSLCQSPASCQSRKRRHDVAHQRADEHEALAVEAALAGRLVHAAREAPEVDALVVAHDVVESPLGRLVVEDKPELARRVERASLAQHLRSVRAVVEVEALDDDEAIGKAQLPSRRGVGLGDEEPGARAAAREFAQHRVAWNSTCATLRAWPLPSAAGMRGSRRGLRSRRARAAGAGEGRVRGCRASERRSSARVPRRSGR